MISRSPQAPASDAASRGTEIVVDGDVEVAVCVGAACFTAGAFGAIDAADFDVSNESAFRYFCSSLFGSYIYSGAGLSSERGSLSTSFSLSCA